MACYKVNLCFLLPFLILYAGLSVSSEAAAKDVGPFFDTLEMVLRHQYVYCTGDSSDLSRSEILMWKRKLEIIAESDSFKVMAKSFFKETGLSLSDVYICEIVKWYQRRSEGNSEYNRLLEDDIKRREKRKVDSLIIDSIFENTESSPFDFAGIPFGVSKKIFKLIMEWRYTKKYKDYGRYIQYKEMVVDNILVNAAFHFDKDGLYRMYELESSGGPVDSLYTKIRNEVMLLGLIIEGKSGISPDHIYRIGRFDITQGRLTVERLWKRSPVSAFVGIGTYHYHYYGKAVVVANKIKKCTTVDVKTGEKNED